MIRALFVQLPAAAVVDALDARRHDRPHARRVLRVAFGTRPGWALAALALVASVLGAALSVVGLPSVGSAGLPGWPSWLSWLSWTGAWLPSAGTVLFVLVVALRLAPALRGAEGGVAVLRGALVALVPALLVLALPQAAVAGAFAIPPEPWTVTVDGETYTWELPFDGALLTMLHHGIAQMAWAAALLVGFLSTRWWPLAPLEPVLVGLGTGIVVEGTWVLNSIGEAIAGWFVGRWVPNVGPVFDLLVAFANAGLALAAWGWLLAMAWWLAPDVVPVGTRPTRIPGLDTVRSLLALTRDPALNR